MILNINSYKAMVKFAEDLTASYLNGTIDRDFGEDSFDLDEDKDFEMYSCGDACFVLYKETGEVDDNVSVMETTPDGEYDKMVGCQTISLKWMREQIEIADVIGELY